MGNAQADAEAFRNGYLDRAPEPGLNRMRSNLDFYLNKIQSQPEGDYIENMHQKWKGQYQLLEIHHGYIQWLFPIREQVGGSGASDA